MDFDWSVLSTCIQQQRGETVKEGTPDAYWLRIPPTPQVVLTSEPLPECRVCLKTVYAPHAQLVEQGQPTNQRRWSQPFWLTKTAAKRVAIQVNDMKVILYLYVYRLHNIFYLEIFDKIPTLLLSPLQARAIHLKHYNRRDYQHLQYDGATDMDSMTDALLTAGSLTDSSISRSNSVVSLAQVGPLAVHTSSATASTTMMMSEKGASVKQNPQSTSLHHFFSLQTQPVENPRSSPSSAAAAVAASLTIPRKENELEYNNAYANPYNVQIVVDLPAVSCSMYNMVSGCYKEVLHMNMNGIRCVVQRGGCELFSKNDYFYYFYYFHSMLANR